jgi:enamine deaminase RidA (YjgF/YER057c/UK114 family)
MAQHLDPPTLARNPLYSHVVRAGNLVFVAGQCAIAPPGEGASGPDGRSAIVGPADPAAQARLCYENVRRALEGAGATMQDVVEINTYSTHTDYRKVLMDLRTTYFTPPYPASTGVVVSSLFSPEAIFEVEVIAVVREGDEPPPQFVDPPTISKSSIYSAVVRAGDLIFTAGQCAHVPTDGTPTRSHSIIGPADPYVQARQCYQNIRYAVEAAGGSMRDVVKLNTWSTHPDWRKVLLEVRPEFFEPPYPASTGVVVSALFKPEAIFEVEAIAVAPGGRGGTPQFLDPPTLSRNPLYSQVVRAGNLVFVSGQCAHAPSGDGTPTRAAGTVGLGDPAAQARQCYENVRLALEAAGATTRDVVKLNTYSTHPEYHRYLREARPEFFEPPYPASTGVIVPSLSKPEWLFEVEAIAVVEA